MVGEFSLSACTIVTPHEVKRNASIKVAEGVIQGFTASAVKDYKLGDSYLVFPALVNAHDHLFGTYYPKIGSGPYICWLPWDYDLKCSPVYVERNKNSPFDIYLLGSYKNLISGVTTVQDHIPHHINDPFIDKLPIRVLKEYCLAHEVSMYDLKWGDGISLEYKRAVKNGLPFITHVEEGFDEESLRGINVLEKHNALSEHTVLIHGIGFSEQDIRTVAKKKANFVWCPGSNYYMFKRTAKLKEIRKAGVNVSIGTDSPASGELNILEEIRFAKKIYKEMYGEELDDKTIVEMITVNPVKALRLQDRLGTLERGKLGDVLVISGGGKNPYTALVQAELKQIALVLMEGRPLYGDDKFEHIFRDQGIEYSRVKVQGKKKLIVGDPGGLLKKMRKAIGFNKELPFLPL